MSKIGIFGGAFNPIHNGHLFVAKESFEIFKLDKIIFVPTGIPVFPKEDLLEKNIRAKLVELAIRNDQEFEISYFEINCSEPSYYISTLKFFWSKDNDIYSIIGEDAFLDFHQWKENSEVINLTKIIVAERHEDHFAKTRNYIDERYKNYENKIYLLSHPFYRISSTVIRERVKHGKHIDYLVPDIVKQSILSNNYFKQ